MVSRYLCIVRSVLFVLAIGALQITYCQNETAQVSGIVTDQNNAPVTGASVTITSTKTGFTRSTTTNGDGYYIIANVQPSTYEISIKSGNFTEFKVTKDVSVAAELAVNVTLSSAVSATVDVTETTDVGEINTTDQSISNVVGQKQLENLPTITRNPYAFVNTLGNVSSGDNGGRGVGVAINGQRSASTSILLNGGENVDTFVAGVGQNVPLDSVDEFRVLSGTFTADFGRATGGVVNLTTKSGQNQFHGSGYEYNRNSDLSSAGFDANANSIPREYFNRNQFGYSLGGPIVRNKLLFFSNTEWERIRSTASLLALVPSAASLAATAPATQAFFSGYTLVGAPTGVNVSTPATGGNCGATPVRCFTFNQVLYTVPSDTGAGIPENGVESANRIDWRVNGKLQIFGIYSLDKSTSPDGSNGNSPYLGFNTPLTTNNTNVTIAGTYAFTNNFLSYTRFTFNRLEQEQPLSSQPVSPSLYLRTSVVSLSGTNVALPGYLPFNPGSAIPFGGPQKVSNLSQEFNYSTGKHQIKFGGQYYNIKDNRAFGAYENAVETLGNSTGGAIQNLYNGVIQTFQAAIDPQGSFPGQSVTLPVSAPSFTRDNKYNEFSLYGMDSFKLFHGFTVNAGLRYEYYGPQANSDPALDSNFYFGGDGTWTAANVRTGSVQIAPNSPIGQLWKSDKNNFGPSVGFAWDPKGDGRSSIRAGYALRFERNFGNVTFNVIQNPPNYGVVSVTAANFGGTPIPITLNNSGPFAGNVGTVTLLPVSLRVVDPNIKNAFAHQYSAAYQRRIGSFTASATFSGTAGRDLYSIADINRAGSGLALLGSLSTACPTLGDSDRLNCQYGAINFRGNEGFSNYNGITFALESANLMHTGLQITSRYTYAVSKDNLSSTFSETGTEFNLGFLDSYDPRLDYGNSDFDVRNRFVTAAVWNVPTNRYFNRGIGRKVLGDFVLAAILNIQSGAPFSVYDCTNGVTTCTRLIPNGTISFSGRQGADIGINDFGFIPLAGQSTVPLPASTLNVDPGENGFLPSNMTARNAFRGPGSWTFDLKASKKIFINEKVNLQFSMDAENLFNHANLVTNVASADVSGFDNVTNIASETNPIVTASKFGRRQIQIGIRLGF